MEDSFLLDLQVLLVLRVILAQLGLQAFWDLLGQKATQVLQVLQGWTVSLVSLAPKALQDFPARLDHLVYRFLQFQGCQDAVDVLAAPVLGTQVRQDLLDQQERDLEQAPQDLLALQALRVKDQLETLDLLALLGLPVRSGLPGLLALPAKSGQVLEEIWAHPDPSDLPVSDLQVLLGPLGLQVPMDLV